MLQAQSLTKAGKIIILYSDKSGHSERQGGKMSVKSEIIRVLEANRSQAVSGQELAGMLHVTRAAVWKAVKSLREEGYAIRAVQNKGYRLEEGNDVLSEEGIRVFLGKDWEKRGVIVKKTVDSTNSCAKRLAVEGAAHGTIVAAEGQTKGRGRAGREFFSPEGTGIYMSLILRPGKKLDEFLPVTAAAAVGTIRAVKSLTGAEAAVKWVNDIYLGQRKICGILTEAIMDFESGGIEAVIIGIGINLWTKEGDFPEELRDVAGSLFPEKVTRGELIARIAQEVVKLSENPGESTVMEEYRRASCVLGREIRWEEKGIRKTGIAEAITDEGALRVKTRDGEVLLHAGEISVRL